MDDKHLIISQWRTQDFGEAGARKIKRAVVGGAPPCREVSCFIYHRGIQDGTVSIMFLPLEEHPRGHFTMFYLQKRHPRWHFIMISPLEGHPSGHRSIQEGHFTMFYLPKGHPRWHFIMFSPLEAHPSGDRSIQEGHFIMFYLQPGHLRGHFIMFLYHRVNQDGTLSCFLHWKGTLGSLEASMRKYALHILNMRAPMYLAHFCCWGNGVQH